MPKQVGSGIFLCIRKNFKLNSNLDVYVRVSVKDQNENRKVESMIEIGIDHRDIFVDKQSEIPILFTSFKNVCNLIV